MIENFIFLFVFCILGFFLTVKYFNFELNNRYYFLIALVFALSHILVEMANLNVVLSFVLWIFLSYIASYEMTKEVENIHKLLLTGFSMTFILAGLVLLIATFVFLSI